MDLLTQGLLGAACARGVAPNDQARTACGIGLAAALLPDADRLITSANDPLLFLDFHRHFTHSLVFIPVAAAIAALILWPVARRRMGFALRYRYALAGVGLAGALDACTSYGTHLLWPFSATPVAWSIVSIVDPVITLALAIGLGVSLYRARTRPVWIALLIVGVYLTLSAWQHQRAQAEAHLLAQARGHTPSELLVKPSFANIILWRTLYRANGRLYADAVWLSPSGHRRTYQGESARAILPRDVIAKSDPLHGVEREVARFSRFTQGWLVRHPQHLGMLGDARFAMLPTQLRPLWGIAFDNRDESIRYVTDRSLSDRERRQFLRMLTGSAVVNEAANR